MSAGRKVHSFSQDWCTPPKYEIAINKMFKGNLKLDPCSNSNAIIKATTKYMLPEKDGLNSSWNFKTIFPTHGPPVTDDASGFIQKYIDHRKAREGAIMDRLKSGDSSIPQMVRVIYADIDPKLHPAACHSVLGHIIHMVKEGRVNVDGKPDITGKYTVAA